jgi:hypothetical protein
MTFWIDYSIEQGVDKFRVKGDTDTEVIDKGLYKPGEVYIVNEDGWLVKTDEVNALLLKHESNKQK